MAEPAAPLPAYPVPLWFDLPEGFTELPLDEPSDERMVRLARIVDTMYPDESPDRKLAYVASSEVMLLELLAQDVVHISSCLYRVDEDEPTLTSGMLTVFVRDQPTGPRETFARRTAAELAGQDGGTGEHREVATMLLPCGPAVGVVEDRAVPGAGRYAGPEAGETDEGDVELVRQAQFFLPFPHGRQVAVLCFMTNDLEEWERYFPLLTHVLGSVSFAPPAPEAAPSPAAVGVAADVADVFG